MTATAQLRATFEPRGRRVATMANVALAQRNLGQSLRRRGNVSLPEEAVLASLGCGNPTALAELKEGETVLDLGSGGGIDVCSPLDASAPRAKPMGLI